MNKYLYISGPVTGKDNYYDQFEECELWIAENTNYCRLNPVKLNLEKLQSDGVKNPNYNDYMRASFYHLNLHPHTDIVLLPGYQGSVGSMEEVVYARKRNFKIMYFVKDNIGFQMIGIDPEMLR